MSQSSPNNGKPMRTLAGVISGAAANLRSRFQGQGQGQASSGKQNSPKRSNAGQEETYVESNVNNIPITVPGSNARSANQENSNYGYGTKKKIRVFCLGNFFLHVTANRTDGCNVVNPVACQNTNYHASRTCYRDDIFCPLSRLQFSN